MSAPLNDHRKGLLITAIGGLFLTVDIPLIKLADGGSWSIVMARTGLTFAASIIIWAVWSIISGRRRVLVPGRDGWIVGALYGFASMCFVAGVFTTSTAHLVFILALNPMFSALLSWVFLRERPKPATFVAMFFMLVGVGIIVSDGISSGNWFGDLIAVLSTFLMACAITVSRASGKDMGLAAIAGTCIPFTFALFMVLTQTGYMINDPKWIVFDGLVIIPIAFICLATGPRFISGPEVAMFYLLETVLAPIWVWIIFAEEPTRATLIGGAILVVTLITHSAWQLYDHRRLRRLERISV